MIKTTTKIEEARCDACGKELLVNESGVHYSYLRPEFGYGSRLDNVIQHIYHVCEDCWEKGAKAMNLKIYPSEDDEPQMIMQYDGTDD